MRNPVKTELQRQDGERLSLASRQAGSYVGRQNCGNVGKQASRVAGRSKSKKAGSRQAFSKEFGRQIVSMQQWVGGKQAGAQASARQV